MGGTTEAGVQEETLVDACPPVEEGVGAVPVEEMGVDPVIGIGVLVEDVGAVPVEVELVGVAPVWVVLVEVDPVWVALVGVDLVEVDPVKVVPVEVVPAVEDPVGVVLEEVDHVVVEGVWVDPVMVEQVERLVWAEEGVGLRVRAARTEPSPWVVVRGVELVIAVPMAGCLVGLEVGAATEIKVKLKLVIDLMSSNQPAALQVVQEGCRGEVDGMGAAEVGGVPGAEPSWEGVGHPSSSWEGVLSEEGSDREEGLPS